MEEDDVCLCCDLDRLTDLFCYHLVSTLGMLPRKRIARRVKRAVRASGKRLTKRKITAEQALAEQAWANFICKGFFTLFVLYLIAGVWILWEFGWIQPFLHTGTCYAFVSTMVVLPAIALVLPAGLYVWRLIAKVAEKIEAIDGVVCAGAKNIIDKADDITDALGITELSDTDLEEADGSIRPGRNMFMCAASPAPKPAAAPKNRAGS